MNSQLDARLDLVSQNPGVYLMKDAAGSVIYVGKAINLHNRLRNYFTPSPQGSPKVLAMIARIADFSTIICSNELEALVLESTLIKKHQPFYNILLRDDKDYPYIKVTLHETYPRLLKAFRIGDDRQLGARYYGPYLSGDVYHALTALQAIFPLKSCRRVLPRDIGRERPCLNYHIGRCIGPCRGDVPADAYRAVMERICRFLEGRYDSLLDDLRSDMNLASEQLRFEAAALLRDRIQALENLMNRQKVVSNKPEDKDVIGIARNGSEICLQKLEIRRGRLVAAVSCFWPERDLPDEEVLAAFITQHYPDCALQPPEILIPARLPDQEALTAYMRHLRQGRCVLHNPARGAGFQLLQMAKTNAAEALRRHTLLGGSGQTAQEEALRLLSGLIRPDQPIHRIEAYDISHTGGEDRAASLIVFQDGRPLRQQYRQFKLDQHDGSDDCAAMRETLRRRLRRLEDHEFGTRPDLILVDGGGGQVAAVRQVFIENGLDLPVAGMVKDSRHRTRGLVLPDGQVIELRRDTGGISETAGLRTGLRADLTQGLPLAEPLSSAGAGAADDPLLPQRQLLLLRLLTAVQDEAHRFAGQYREKLQKKRHTRFSLEGIPGVGPARRRLLLSNFLTIKKVSEASLAELAAVKGLPEPAAAAVYKYFHPEA